MLPEEEFDGIEIINNDKWKGGFWLKSITNLSKKIKYIYEDIHQMKKVSELIDYIPAQSIEKAATLLLIIWILSPILVMFSSISMRDMEQSELIFKQGITSTYWYEILQTIGFLGCILGIIVFSKSILKAKTEKISIKQYLKNNFFLLFLFLMLFWSILSCLASDNIALSFNGTPYRKDGLVTYFTYYGIFCCGYVVRNKRFVQCILELFTLSAAVLSILMLINSETLNNLLGLTVDSAVFSNSNHFAYYLCMALMCALLQFEIEKKSALKLMFRIAIFAVITATLVQNRSLGPYLAVVVGLICSVILTIWLDKKFLKRVLAAVIVFITVTLIMNISDNHLYIDLKILGIDLFKIAKMSPAKDLAHVGSDRWPLWMNGLRFITEKPLFGYGPDNLGAQYAKVNIVIDRPHNELIQFAASLGIPAALFYIMALAGHFIVFLKQRKQVSTVEIGMLCTVIAYLASSMFGNTMYYTSPFFFMVLGLSGGMQKLLEMKHKVLLLHQGAPKNYEAQA